MHALTQRFQKFLKVFRGLHFPFPWEIGHFILHFSARKLHRWLFFLIYFYVQVRSWPLAADASSPLGICASLSPVNRPVKSSPPPASAPPSHWLTARLGIWCRSSQCRGWWQGGAFPLPPLSAWWKIWIRAGKRTSSKRFDADEQLGC